MTLRHGGVIGRGAVHEHVKLLTTLPAQVRILGQTERFVNTLASPRPSVFRMGHLKGIEVPCTKNRIGQVKDPVTC